MKVVIIDDVETARSMLKTLISSEFPHIEVVGEASDLAQGVIEINKKQPDLVFCDIDMPGISGMQITDFFTTGLPFELIYVTAYSEFLLQALHNQATDYILKPVDPAHLKAAIHRAADRLSVGAIRNPKQAMPSKIAIPVLEGMVFIDIHEIVYLRAEAAYTQIFLTDNTQFTASRNIGEFEELLLTNPVFFRTHRSYIVNLQHIKKYLRQGGASVVMSNDHEVGVSRERKDEFLEIIDREFGI